jgi:hypothetical protein
MIGYFNGTGCVQGRCRGGETGRNDPEIMLRRACVSLRRCVRMARHGVTIAALNQALDEADRVQERQGDGQCYSHRDEKPHH